MSASEQSEPFIVGYYYLGIDLQGALQPQCREK